MPLDQLPHLETFAKTAELSSFTAAARTLGLTQAAVSQRIRILERELGLALFHREGGHVILTAAGKRLHSYAQRILLLHQEAREDITGQKVAIVGELSLAASSVPGEYLLPALLADFRHKHPHIQVRAAIADSLAVLDQVEQGHVNLGLVGGQRDRAHLTFRAFIRDRLTLVVHTGHPWSGRTRVSLADLCRQPLVLREAGSGSRWCLEQALTQAGKSAKDLDIALELGSNKAIEEAVLRGMGAAVLSHWAVEKAIEAGRLHGLQVAGLPLERDLFLVWDHRRALPVSARLFLDLVEAGPRSESSS